MNIAVIINSRHLSRRRRRGLTFVSEGNAHSIYINAFVFARIIRDPALSTEEVSTRVFNQS